MRLGLFGGSFDPIHLGHLVLAECCREQCALDRVIFLPAAVPPHKKGQSRTPGDARAEMIELAIAGNESFELSRYELDRGGVNYTVDSLTHVREQHPDAELFLLVGADMFYDLPNWREARRIVEMAIPAVARRPGSPELDYSHLAPLVSPERLEVFLRYQVDMPAIAIRATDLRNRAAAGRSLRYQTPRAVEMYIRTHGLYRAEAPPS